MRTNRTVTAAIMVGIGFLFLSDRFAFLGNIDNSLWALLFLIGGAIFIALYARQQSMWWALYPGFALVAMAAAVFAGSVGGVVVMALGGAALIALYVTTRGRSWPLIGGGALLSLALMAFIQRGFPQADTAWLLFAGLAATFLALHFTVRERTNWALFAAVALGGLALLSLLTSPLAGVLIALVLLGVGGYMLWREAMGVEAGRLDTQGAVATRTNATPGAAAHSETSRSDAGSTTPTASPSEEATSSGGLFSRKRRAR